MEDHPHQQHSTSPVQVGSSPQRQQGQRLSSQIRRLLNFVQTYPLLVWGGIWVSILLVAMIAVGGLLSPGFTTGRRATGAAFGSSALGDTEVASGHGRTFWIFGAIALTCTAGSILVSKRLSRPPLSPYKLPRPKRPKPYVAVTAPAQPTAQPTFKAPAKAPAKPTSKAPAKPTSKSSKARPASQQRRKPSPKGPQATQPKRLRPFSPDDLPLLPTPPLATPLSTVPPQPTPRTVSFAVGAKPVAPPAPRPQPAPVGVQPLVPEAIAPVGQRPVARKKAPSPMKDRRQTTPLPKPAPVSKGVPQAAVTVVPVEENHPLDWQESSIADLMDIRKRHSLSSWM